MKASLLMTALGFAFFCLVGCKEEKPELKTVDYWVANQQEAKNYWVANCKDKIEYTDDNCKVLKPFDYLGNFDKDAANLAKEIYNKIKNARDREK